LTIFIEKIDNCFCSWLNAWTVIADIYTVYLFKTMMQNQWTFPSFKCLFNKKDSCSQFYRFTVLTKSNFYSCSMDPALPKPGMPLPPHVMAHSRMPVDHLSGVKHMPVVARGSPAYPQAPLPEMCYDTRPPPSASQYDPPQYPTGRGQANWMMHNQLPYVWLVQCCYLFLNFILEYDLRTVCF